MRHKENGRNQWEEENRKTRDAKKTWGQAKPGEPG